MKVPELISYHVEKKTPLFQLGNLVRHFEDAYRSTEEKGRPVAYFKRRARDLRAVVTGVFIERFLKGEYGDDVV